jgi:hypothetical protein
LTPVAWGVVYYKGPDGSVPAEKFLDSCPSKIEARLLAVLESVRAAPPPAFSGGGMWEAMHGSMNGYYEIRVSGPGRVQYRLFCILDNAETKEELERRGFSDPQITVINGMSKPVGELFTDGEYRKQVRDLGDDYRARFPRRIAET